MKILQLTAENFKKLRLVEITLDGRPLTQLTGRNGQGKTSTIDALWFLIKGQKALPDRKSDVVRRGTEKARVSGKLANGDGITFTITRTVGMDGNPPTLTIVPAVHKDAGKTPQDYLDDLFSILTFDPLKFAEMSTAEQIEELKKTAKVDLDFEQLNAANQADYQERHGVTREIKQLDGQLAGMHVVEGLPKEKVDTAAIVAKLNDADQANKEAQKVFAAKQELGAKAAQLVLECERKAEDVEAAERKIKLLEAELEKAQKEKRRLELERSEMEIDRIDAKEAWEKAPAGKFIDVGALTVELQSAEMTNQAIEKRAWYDKLKADRDAKQRQVDKLTRQMEAREEKKRAALGKAKIPVEGLTFDEREVKYNGIPIEMLGEGEQIRISTLIGMAANPKLRLLCIRHGEALDPEGLKQLAEMAKEHDFQIIMARVDTSGKVGVVIEDGSVIATNEEE
jgi:DNA repair exonuclease SbcCD ATPase subunit